MKQFLAALIAINLTFFIVDRDWVCLIAAVLMSFSWVIQYGEKK